MVLTLAVGLLAASVAWALSRDGGSGMHRGPGGWMMGYVANNDPEPVTGVADAKAKAQAYADRLGLEVDEVLRFQRNYYVKLVDRKGDGAAEVLVDPTTSALSLEYGPAMMWNTRYGMAGGRLGRVMHGSGQMMMGRYGTGMMGAAGGSQMMDGAVTTAPGDRLTIAQARSVAQRRLDGDEPGVTAERGGDAFPGYYTFETLKEGKIVGMISVNASTGAVWPHWWHGKFVAAA